jgi:ribosomal protein S18 acetylase RimI-like enzyme
MPLSLRPVLPQDETFVYQLLYENFHDKLMAHLWNPQIREPLLRMQINGQRSTYSAQYPRADHGIIVLDDHSVGRIILDRGPQFTTLVDITIAKKHRGAGIGTVLIRSICTEADMTRRAIRLHVDITNRARELYLRHGFRILEEQELNWLMERQPGAHSLVGNP